MLTGRMAFQGEDVSEILASVIKADVKLDLLPADLHARVREALTRCLQKDLKRRYTSIMDAPYEIEQALADHIAFSESGTVIYMPWTSSAAPARTLVWVARNGKEEPLAAPPNPYSSPRISPDGKRVALTVGTTAKRDIYVWDLLRKTLSKSTFDGTLNAVPVWTPDGKRIAFLSNQDGNYQVYWKTPEGTGTIEPLGSVPDYALVPWSWSRDGKALVMEELSGGTINNIGMLLIQDHKWVPLLQEKCREVQPQVSLDGRWMAYTWPRIPPIFV